MKILQFTYSYLLIFTFIALLISCKKDDVAVVPNCEKITELDANNQVTETVIIQNNEAGNPISIIKTYAQGNFGPFKELNEYNAQGLIKKYFYYNNNVLDYYYEYEYDNAGKLTKSTLINNLQGAASYYSIYEYNNKGLLAKTSNFSLTNELQNYSTNEYNDLGKIVKTSNFDRNNVMTYYTNYVYDNLTKKELTYQKNAFEADKLIISYSATYNDKNQVIESSYNSEYISNRNRYEYNSFGKFSKTFFTNFNEKNEIISDIETTYEYDSNQRRTKALGYEIKNNTKTLIATTIYELKCE